MYSDGERERLWHSTAVEPLSNYSTLFSLSLYPIRAGYYVSTAPLPISLTPSHFFLFYYFWLEFPSFPNNTQPKRWRSSARAVQSVSGCQRDQPLRSRAPVLIVTHLFKLKSSSSAIIFFCEEMMSFVSVVTLKWVQSKISTAVSKSKKCLLVFS